MKVKRREELKDFKLKLEYLLYIINEVLNDNMSQMQATKKLNLKTQSTFQGLTKSIIPIAKKAKLTREELSGILKDMQTPAEKLLRDLLQIKDPLIVLPYINVAYTSGEFLNYIDDDITKTIFDFYYGFNGNQSHSLRDTGKNFKRSYENVRIELEKAKYQLRPYVCKCFYTMEEQQLFKKWNSALSKVNIDKQNNILDRVLLESECSQKTTA